MLVDIRSICRFSIILVPPTFRQTRYLNQKDPIYGTIKLNI